MRDEMDGRIWTDHHEAFSHLLGDVADALRAGLARFAAWDGSTSHLFALAAAFAMTTLTFHSAS